MKKSIKFWGWSLFVAAFTSAWWATAVWVPFDANTASWSLIWIAMILASLFVFLSIVNKIAIDWYNDDKTPPDIHFGQLWDKYEKIQKGMLRHKKFATGLHVSNRRRIERLEAFHPPVDEQESSEQ